LERTQEEGPPVPPQLPSKKPPKDNIEEQRGTSKFKRLL